MSRTLPFGFQAAQRAAVVRPALEVAWSDHYGGRPVLRGDVDADDSLVTNHAALTVVGSTLVQLKSRGLAVEAQRRNATTLAVISGWTNLATAISADVPVALTQSSGSVFAAWRDSSTVVKVRRSTDAGATWAAETTLHTAGGTNTLYSIMASPDGLLAVEERQTASTALVYVYVWSGTAWSLIHSFDTGALHLWGGGVDTEGGTFLVFAGDYLQASTAGTVTLRETRVYDIDNTVLLGVVHQGSEGGVRWREPRAVYLSTSQTHYILTTVQVPRGSGDASDRVALFPYQTARIGAHHPLGPPRSVYAVEDDEQAAVCFGAGAVFVMAGLFVQRLVEGSAGATVTLSSLDMVIGPEEETLDVAGPGMLESGALQLRVRLGVGATLIDQGVFWLAGRVGASREGWQGTAYGLWGMLRREQQQMSAALLETSGDAMTPGHILELVLRGLGFEYSEDATLATVLHPAVGARMLWTLRYGRDYTGLVRGLLRWTGTELRTGVAANGTTPTAYVLRPGSRFGPAPSVATALGTVGGHPALQVVSVDPETITDVTVLPGGWDHQIPLSGYVDRQLTLEASEAVGVVWDTTPATRALARALAGAEAGMVRCRPALEVELWDTVSVTDGPAGLSGARRLVRSLAVVAGQGRWEMRLALGLE